MKRDYKLHLKIFIIVLLIINTVIVEAQDENQIKNSGKYYWGLGWDNNLRMADKYAIDSFIDQISSVEKHKFFQISKNQSRSLDDFTKEILKTYANSSFKDLHSKTYEQTNDVYTLRYIEKEHLNHLFQNRETKIRDYFSMAEKAEKENRISDALQKYYWTLLLLRSHPENQTLEVMVNSASLLLIDYLPEKIKYMFKKISFGVNNIKANTDEPDLFITLDVLYKDTVVDNLQFTYKNNNSKISLICKNGLGIIEINKENNIGVDSIRLQVEYRFEDEAQIDKVLTDIYKSNLRIPIFKLSEFTIKIPPIQSGNEQVTNSQDYNIEILNLEPAKKYPEQINTSISSIIKNIESRNLNNVRSLFTESGWDDINYMMNYGKAKLMSHNFELKVLKINNEYAVRKIPMYFTFESNKQFVEDLVFYFNDSLKVTGITFSISDVAINEIKSKKSEWGTNLEKYQIIRFMENYKTAYCFERLDYIEKIFADEALIIVGKRLKYAPAALSENGYRLKNKQFKYVKKSKSDYLKKLKMVFKSNEYINIHFEDNVVKKGNKGDKVYGIQIAQSYTSTNYSDKGYLFLLIDFKDSLNPLIYVRAWQPEKNADGSLFGYADFTF